MEAIMYGEVIGADFSDNTIVLEMKEDFSICAGEFALVKLNSIKDKIALEEFINNLNK